MGDDQNVHVIICLSHLLNLLFKEFVFRNAKNIVFCVERENGTINRDIASFNLMSHIPVARQCRMRA